MDKYIKRFKRININEVDEHFWSNDEFPIKSTSSINIAEDFYIPSDEYKEVTYNTTSLAAGIIKRERNVNSPTNPILTAVNVHPPAAPQKCFEILPAVTSSSTSPESPESKFILQFINF